MPECHEPMPDQSLGEISNEIQRLLQQAVLRCYPNPERRGCPGEAVLRSVSCRFLPIRDAYWEHVTHCSPCFQEFLEFRKDLTMSRKRLVLRNRLLVGAVFAAVAIAGVLVMQAPHKRGQPTLMAEALSDVDMRPFSVTRGDSDNQPPSEQYAGILTRRRSQLNVILPLGAEEGNYEVRLLDDNRREVIPSTNATASYANHLVRFKVRFDLTSISPGRYVLASRREGGGWMTAPVLVR
jgi:hypothetical protein